VGALAGMRARDLVLNCLMIPPPAEGGPLPYCGINAPPTASQASVPGVARRTRSML
jgi:hypothetical protein